MQMKWELQYKIYDCHETHCYLNNIRKSEAFLEFYEDKEWNPIE